MFGDSIGDQGEIKGAAEALHLDDRRVTDKLNIVWDKDKDKHKDKDKDKGKDIVQEKIKTFKKTPLGWGTSDGQTRYCLIKSRDKSGIKELVSEWEEQPFPLCHKTNPSRFPCSV